MVFECEEQDKNWQKPWKKSISEKVALVSDTCIYVYKTSHKLKIIIGNEYFVKGIKTENSIWKGITGKNTNLITNC